MADAVAQLGGVAVPREITPKKADKIATVARDFEAVLLGQMVNEMLATVEVGSFGGGFAEETWRSLLAEEYANQIAQSGTTGISQSIESAIRSYETSR